MSVGGRHFHHYNLGIGLLAGIGAIALRGKDHHRHHPLTAASYGVANALIVDEAALLIDLKDVYWAKEGRTSVDIAVGVIAIGGLAVAGSSLWPAAVQELRPRNRRTFQTDGEGVVRWPADLSSPPPAPHTHADEFTGTRGRKRERLSRLLGDDPFLT